MAATIYESWQRVTATTPPVDAFGQTLSFVIPASGLVGDLFLDISSSGALGGGTLCDFPALAAIASVTVSATGGATLHSYNYMPVCEYMLAEQSSASVRAAVLTNAGGTGATTFVALAAPIFTFWSSWANNGEATPLYTAGSATTITVAVTFNAGSLVAGTLGTLTLNSVGLNYRLYSVSEAEFASYAALRSAGQLIYPSQDWRTVVQQAVTSTPASVDAGAVIAVTPTTSRLLGLQLRTVTQAAYTARTYMVKTNPTAYSITSATTPSTVLQATVTGVLSRDAATNLSRDSPITTGFTNYSGPLYWVVPARNAADCPTISSLNGLSIASISNLVADSWLDVTSIVSARYAFSSTGVITRA